MATKVKTGVIDSSAITSALIANASITADDLHATLDLTGKTVTVATATAGDNDTSVASTSFVSTAIANLADSAPSTLNTLNELAAALGDDANYATTTTNAIAAKAPLASPTFTGDVKAAANATGAALIKGVSGNQTDRNTGGYPQYTFVGNEGTGMRRVSSNILALDAGGAEALRIIADGNVGIGITPSTASGTTRLQIHHTNNTAVLQLTNGGGGGTGANDGGQVRFDDNENMYVVNKEAGLLVLSTSNTDRLTIKADGNVGIGTAGYGTYYSGNRVLGLGVGTTIRGASTGTDPYTTIATNTYHDASAWKYIHADFASSYEQYNGTHTFHVAASGSAAGTVSFNEAMRIKADGNVGIGTASMAADGSSKFQVAGRLGVMENTGTQLQMSTGSTYSWFEAWDNSADRAPKRPICFNPWGGAVGIGTTAPHVGKLHVIGGGYAQLQLASNHSDNTNKTAGIVATNYANQTVSVMQMYNQNGNNGIYYGSADGAHRGIQSHYWYVNENYNSTSGHKLSGSINSTGAWVIRSSHQGDTVGNLKVTSQFGSSPNTSENCLINVSNGQQMIQIMAWAGNGARIGTRTGGWNSNAGGDLHITRQDSMQIKLGSGGPVLANGTAISSDRRLKKNINSIADGQLAKINALTPRTFEWKDPIDWKAGTQEGFIAQEVELVIPEAVREEKMVPDPDDTSRDFEGNVKLLRNDVITARLIKAVQELSAELDAAKARITTLEG